MARGFLPRRWRNLILPDGAMELIINLGDPQTLCARNHPGKRTLFRRSWISGMPLCEFSEQVIELDDVFGPQINELRDRLGEKTTADAGFDLLEEWLRAQQRTPPTRAVGYALRAIENGADSVRIGRMAAEIGISHKHLLREFHRCVGLTPKTFSRLCSFQRVIQSVGHRPEVEWADTARKCGYYDQAHLIREFRAFSGFTPASYLVKRGPFLNYLEV